MAINDDIDQTGIGGYCGYILNGNYTRALKNRVLECIEAFRTLEKTGSPAILYLAAWQEDEKSIWYEYASKYFVELLECDYSKTVEVFQNSIVDRRIYKHMDINADIEKETIVKRELNNVREALRDNSKKTGIIDAVYKVSLGETRYVWMKDQATIDIYEQDKICLSLGSLTIVTKEMKAEEEREKLVLELQGALENVKTLSGLLPICANCKKIRDDKGYWNQIEAYIRDHSEADFSHSICPECGKKLYPELDLWKNNRKGSEGR